MATRSSPFSWSAWLPDGKHLVLVGRDATATQNRLFVQGLDGGKPRPVSPEGIRAPVAVSTDGKWIAAAGPDARMRVYPVDGGEARIVRGALEGDLPLQWAADDRFLYVLQGPGLFSSGLVFRIDLVTDRRSPWKVLLPEDPAGVAWIAGVSFTPDGLSYAYTYSRVLSDLYLAEGLR